MKRSRTLPHILFICQPTSRLSTVCHQIRLLNHIQNPQIDHLQIAEAWLRHFICPLYPRFGVRVAHFDAFKATFCLTIVHMKHFDLTLRTRHKYTMYALHQYQLFSSTVTIRL